MQFFPIHLQLQQQPVLIVGGGHIAYRKAQLLAEAGACIHIVAPDILPELHTLVQHTQGQYIARAFSPTDISQPLHPYKLVIAATNDPNVNAQVYHTAEQANLLVNSVDDLPHCRFIFPAIVDRAPITLSISSQGISPVLARRLRGVLESTIHPNYGRLARFAGQWRHAVKDALPHAPSRRIFWEHFFDSPLAEQVLQAHVHTDTHAHAFSALLAQFKADQPPSNVGEVYLVGAGPGDPDLLTFKALRFMQQADVIVYDRLVSPAILDLCRRDADKVYVGKARAAHTLPQQHINHLLISLAQQGKRVCRLKGGDPFIFGRGGEELEDIVNANIPFYVVPGITAASGCAAYAGIPLTHRDYAQSVRFLTGHLKEGTPALPWPELIYEHQTLVLYMGLVGLEHTMQQLIAHGIRSDMPVALISKGTWPDQQVITGTVSTIAQQAAHTRIAAPTITIVGEVVKLRERYYGM